MGRHGEGVGMKVEAILEAKGRRVDTTPPGTTVAAAVHEMTTRGIGALVVSADGERVDGVVSERNVVRALSRRGAGLLNMAVSEIMSRNVPVCTPHDTISHVMAEMTRTRNRHLPVVEGGKLRGIISIGDVVKNRLEELELETAVLRDSYIAHRLAE
jgi:CBS domain-containing protein